MADDQKKNNLSQEGKKFASLAKRFMRQASIATKNLRTFGEEHSIVDNNIRNACALLKNILIGKESITFTFLAEKLARTPQRPGLMPLPHLSFQKPEFPVDNPEQALSVTEGRSKGRVEGHQLRSIS